MKRCQTSGYIPPVQFFCQSRTSDRLAAVSSLRLQLLHGCWPAGAGPCCPLPPRTEANLSAPKVSPFLRATQHHPVAPALPRLLCTAPGCQPPVQASSSPSRCCSVQPQSSTAEAAAMRQYAPPVLRYPLPVAFPSSSQPSALPLLPHTLALPAESLFFLRYFFPLTALILLYKLMHLHSNPPACFLFAPQPRAKSHTLKRAWGACTLPSQGLRGALL